MPCTLYRQLWTIALSTFLCSLQPCLAAKAIPPQDTNLAASNKPPIFSSFKLLYAPHLDNQKLTSQAYKSIDHLKGLPINASTLQNMLDSLSKYYQEQGFVLSKAYLPQQTIDNGQVSVLVVNPHFNRFSLENSSQVRDSYLEYLMSGIKELEGKDVSAQELNSKIRKLADLGTFSILGEVSNSDLHGLYKDIDFKATPTHDRFNFALFSDNQGNKSAGRYRFGGLIEVQNPTGSADYLSLIYARSNEKQNNYTFNYQLPINSHPTLWGLDICYSDYELTGIYRELGAQGTSLSIDSYLTEPLIRTDNSMLKLTAGIRYRKLVDEYANFDLKFEKHTWSGYIGAHGFYSNNNWFFNYDTKGYITRIYCDDQYEAVEERTYLTLEGLFALGYHFKDNLMARSSLRYQLANSYVDGADVFLAGGDIGLRAYEFGDIAGDGGIIWKNELSYFPSKTQNFSITPHIETARVYSHYSDSEKAHSAGLTLNYQYKGLNLELDLSHGLGSKPLYAKDRTATKFNISYRF